MKKAQSRIEGFHFDSRKQVLSYDNILNQQRQIVYERRKNLLLGEGDEVAEVQAEVIEAIPEIK